MPVPKFGDRLEAGQRLVNGRHDDLPSCQRIFDFRYAITDLLFSHLILVSSSKYEYWSLGIQLKLYNAMKVKSSETLKRGNSPLKFAGVRGFQFEHDQVTDGVGDSGVDLTSQTLVYCAAEHR